MTITKQDTKKNIGYEILMKLAVFYNYCNNNALGIKPLMPPNFAARAKGIKYKWITVGPGGSVTLWKEEEKPQYDEYLYAWVYDETKMMSIGDHLLNLNYNELHKEGKLSESITDRIAIIELE